MRIAAMLWILPVLICGCAVIPSPVPLATPEKQADGVVIPLANGFLRLKPYSDDVIRVVFSTDQKFFSHHSLSAVGAPVNICRLALALSPVAFGILTVMLSVVVP